MEKNKNLAEYLKDEETIKNYLHKDRPSIIDLLKFAYEPFNDNWKIKLSLIIYPLVNGVIPVMQAFIMYYLVDLIEKQSDLKTMILTIAIYGILFLLCSVISHQIDHKTYAIYMKSRMNLWMLLANL